MNTYATVYSDKWKAIHSIKAISVRERERLAAALLDYGCLGIEPKGLSNLAQGMFDAIRTSLFKKKAGAPEGNQNARKDKSENNSETIIDFNSENNSGKQSENNSVQTTTTTTTTTTNQKKDKEKSATASTPPRFHKPTVEEVRAFIQENNYHVNPNDFVNFYESKGWLVGKSPMKDWKAAVRTWESKEKNENPAKFVEEKDEYVPITPLDKCTVCGSRNVVTKGMHAMCLNGDCGVSFIWHNGWKEEC